MNKCQKLEKETRYLEECQQQRILKIKKMKKQKNKTLRTLIARKALFYINLGLLGGSILGIHKIVDKKIHPTYEYETTYTEYDSSLENPEVKVVYEKERNNKISVTEYSPWENPGYFRDEYQRNVYTYSIQNFDDIYSLNVEDYLNEEYKNYITLSETKKETTKELPNDDYSENKYVISQVYQNKRISIPVENKAKKMVANILFSGLLIIADGLIYIIYVQERKQINEEERKELKESLMEEKRLLLEDKGKRNDFYKKLEEMKKELREEYETLPKFVKNDKDIQKRVKKLIPNLKSDE